MCSRHTILFIVVSCRLWFDLAFPIVMLFPMGAKISIFPLVAAAPGLQFMWAADLMSLVPSFAHPIIRGCFGLVDQ